MGAPWDAALAIAELEPRATLRGQRRHRGRRPDSLPLVEAIHYYVEANGVLPSREQFKEFRRRVDVKVETRSGGWTEALKATIEYRADLGLTEPTAMPATGKPPAGASRQVKVPAGGIPGAAPGVKKGKSKYTEADCVTAVRRYLEADEGPHNQKGYLLFAGRHGLPSPSYFGTTGAGARCDARPRQRRGGEAGRQTPIPGMSEDGYRFCRALVLFPIRPYETLQLSTSSNRNLLLPVGFDNRHQPVQPRRRHQTSVPCGQGVGALHV